MLRSNDSNLNFHSQLVRSYIQHIAETRSFINRSLDTLRRHDNAFNQLIQDSLTQMNQNTTTISSTTRRSNRSRSMSNPNQRTNRTRSLYDDIMSLYNEERNFSDPYRAFI